MTSIEADPVVVLRDGPAVPLAAVLFALDLERRGFSLRLDGPDLMIAPGSRLTAADRTTIRQYRWHLMEIVVYADGTVQ